MLFSKVKERVVASLSVSRTNSLSSACWPCGGMNIFLSTRPNSQPPRLCGEVNCFVSTRPSGVNQRRPVADPEAKSTPEVMPPSNLAEEASPNQGTVNQLNMVPWVFG